jgi:hypothetical protein
MLKLPALHHLFAVALVAGDEAVDDVAVFVVVARGIGGDRVGDGEYARMLNASNVIVD